jgi:hypothetical protein
MPIYHQSDMTTQMETAGASREGDLGKVEIRIARTVAEVESLRQAWTSWGGHRDSDIDVVLMIIDSYPEALRPHVIALYRNGEPDAILIGRLEKKRIAFKIGYLTILRPLARILNFVYGAVRGNASPENSEILIREVVRCLQNDEADVAFLEFVPVDSPLYQKALSVPGFLNRDSHPAAQLHDLLEVPDSMDLVYQRMSSDRRAVLRKRIRKLQAHPAGELRIVCYRELAEIERMFVDVERIAKNTYQRGLGAGFSDTPEVRERLGLAARKGWLQAYVEYLGDRPVSFWIGMLYGDTFVSEYMGFDTEFRQFAPGMVLILKVIEGFCTRANRDDVKKLDFGLGHAEYKAFLSTQNWREAALYIFGPTWKGAFLKSVRWGTQSIDQLARKVLVSTAIFPPLKRIWRDKLAKRSKEKSEEKRPVREEKFSAN